MAQYDTWEDTDLRFREEFPTRPYAAGRRYEDFRPAYRYGYECAVREPGRSWDEVKDGLRTGWDRFEGKGPGGAAWENVKDAVRDAWDRIARRHRLDADKMSEPEVDRLSHGGRPH